MAAASTTTASSEKFARVTSSPSSEPRTRQRSVKRSLRRHLPCGCAIPGAGTKGEIAGPSRGLFRRRSRCRRAVIQPRRPTPSARGRPGRRQRSAALAPASPHPSRHRSGSAFQRRRDLLVFDRRVSCGFLGRLSRFRPQKSWKTLAPVVAAFLASNRARRARRRCPALPMLMTGRDARPAPAPE